MDQVEDIKAKNDIVEVVSGYLTLKRAGANFKARCPFHNEKSPSFMVSPERQSFKCFGCSEGGDVITFIEKMEGLDFYNALKLLAERAGVQLQNSSVKFGEKEFKSDHKTRLFEINEWAKKVYEKIITEHPKAQKARDYIDKRGLSSKTRTEFEIGYAPNSWDFLLRFLRSKGYTDNEIVEAGLAVKSDGGKIYDRFRGRIVFPINNAMGSTIAFTSRILEDDGKSPKYINSSESAIYTKGKTIYGLDKARLAIKESGMAVMVEGNMDVIACHQAGFANVVATSGTALTLDQLKILVRYSPLISFCFDSDNAGQTAMKRAIKIALSNDISVKIIRLPAPHKDPDEAIKADPEIWKKAVSNAKPALEYWVDSLFEAQEELDVAAKKTISREILPVIKIIASEIEKEHYIKYLGEKLSVSEKSLFDALNKTKKDWEFHDSIAPQTVSEKPALTLLEKILGLIWIQPELIASLKGELDDICVADNLLLDFLTMVKAKTFDKQRVKPQEAAILDQLAISILGEGDFNDEATIQSEFLYLLGRHRAEAREKIREEFAQKIRKAEQEGDKEALKKLLSEFSSLIK